jgi:hypothetical protein
VKETLQRYKELQDIIAILGLMNFRGGSIDGGTPGKSNVFSQPFFVAEVFTGSPGKYVSLAETIQGFNFILSGEWMIFLSNLSIWLETLMKPSRRRLHCSNLTPHHITSLCGEQVNTRLGDIPFSIRYLW